METSLFSNSWYRVAGLKPRLRSHTEIHRHIYRGKDWYVLQDHSTGQFNRFSREAYYIIGLLDGQRSMQEIWENACEQLGDDMPTQDEVIGLLSQLYRSDTIVSDMPPDIADMLRRRAQVQRGIWMSKLGSPLALRFPVLDPDRFLNLTNSLIGWIFGWAGAVLWLAIVLPALTLVVTHWNELTMNLADRVLALENLFILGLIYPVIKTIHEFSHAYAVKRWGGEVHEIGIMLLVFMPIPYIDASASSAFQDKRQRMMVGAAGILTEMFLASLAAILWVNIEPGLMRAVAFNVMLIAGVSTLFFNGNPLLRFDAYYVLSDYLEIPNLGNRGTMYIGYLFKRYLLNISEARSPASAPGESAWLGIYALASFLYRIFIAIRIALFVAAKFFYLGILLVGWAMVNMFFFPLFRLFKNFSSDQSMKEKKGRAILMVASILILVLILLVVIPIPMFTLTEGVVWVPEKSRIHAGVNGFVDRLIVESGSPVKAGDALILFNNPDIPNEVRVLEARLAEYEARYRESLTGDRTESDILKDEVENVKAELGWNRNRLKELTIRSPGDGIFLLPEAEDMPGRFISRGSPLGYVVDPAHTTVRIVARQSVVDRIRNHTVGGESRFSGEMMKRWPSVVVRELPEASKEIPSLALSIEGGGKVALDPRERSEPRSFEKLFKFDIHIPGKVSSRVGERVYVRFRHPPAPLVFRWYQDIRRVLLRRLEV